MKTTSKGAARIGVLALAFAITTLNSAGRTEEDIDPCVRELGAGFESGNVQVNGTSLHYVRGGKGPALILLHGFPQNWYEFHKVMPRLAKRFTVVAIDLRGVGGSTVTPSGYDAANLAEDVRQCAEQLHLKQSYIVGHDIGGMVAYAFARKYPPTVRGVMILDVPLPGLEPWDEIMEDPSVWHVRFHQVPELAEELVAGRQAIYFRYFLDKEHFSDAELSRFVAAYATPEQLRTAFECYRAFPQDAKFNAAERGAIELPLVIGAGDESPFHKILPKTAESMRKHGCKNVNIETIKGSSHYVADEKPELVAELIERYARP
jgi:pimeloyl-ACP methyl ester carboxylesterase